MTPAPLTRKTGNVRTLMIFVDGLGLGGGDPRLNPVAGGPCPHLRTLLRAAKPIDATLGVAGLPQSATGQAALLTGVNAARRMGRHVEGFPGPRLRELVRRRNLLSRLAARGYRAAFANAYYLEDAGAAARMRRPSVTTVAALAAFGAVRQTAELLRGEAVYQDLTREALRARGFTGPLTTPEEAAQHLLALAQTMDFTLFEYFQTDRVAHRGNASDRDRVLDQLDRFLGVLRTFPESRNRRLLLCSDHGNLEDASTTSHTMNPVPFFAAGTGSRTLRKRVKSLLDVTPALLALYPARTRNPAARRLRTPRKAPS